MGMGGTTINIEPFVKYSKVYKDLEKENAKIREKVQECIDLIEMREDHSFFDQALLEALRGIFLR